jgi:hypothetical protein
MSTIVVDSENAISSPETAPDKLRKEIGMYWKKVAPPPIGQISLERPRFFDFSEDKITQFFIDSVQINDYFLIPRKRFNIAIKGNESQFRDQSQWREYCTSEISVGAKFLDHTFMWHEPTIESRLDRNFHNPQYEDLTKTYPTLQLLNYTLLSYPYKDLAPDIAKVSDIKTLFDPETYRVVTENNLETLFNQFETRIDNYSGSIQDSVLKQKNIFDLISDPNIQSVPSQFSVPIFQTSSFPYSFKIDLPDYLPTATATSFRATLREHGKTKNLYQSIKRNSDFFTRSFNLDGDNIEASLHNATNILFSDLMSGFSEGADEIFMLPEQEVSRNDTANRFVDQLNNVVFVSKLRSFIKSNMRDYADIAINPKNCPTFFMGYKIEKYINENTGGSPTQTFYTMDSELVDTQLKYGRPYYYVVKALVGILGSSYSYRNMFMSSDGDEMTSESGTVASETPSVFADVSDAKFKAFVEVNVEPSFQVLEIEVANFSTCFVDSPTLPPEAMFYNEKNKSSVEMILRPSFFKIESVVSQSDRELGRELQMFRESDASYINLLEISQDTTLRPTYFSGIYEIYRMETPPKSNLDFIDNFLATVDMSTQVLVQGREPFEQLSPPIKPIVGVREQSNQIAHYEDQITPNKKYYYLFRAKTYHGTPSNVTITYEVELLRDSDEYKLLVSEYEYPEPKTYTYNTNVKRIIKIEPNFERLLFRYPESEDPAPDNWSLDNNSLVAEGVTRTIKVRVTSKHTGKKIDLNLNFKLTKDDSFSNPTRPSGIISRN